MFKSGGRPILTGVQALRALAATAVAVTHTQEDFGKHLSLPGITPEFVPGVAGVDLFFVISGFVMVYSSEGLFGNPGAFISFAARRLIRIVPLYWILTSIMLLWVLMRGFAASDASPAQAIASYFFIPYPRPSGPISPLYGVGWTVNFEMMFYLIFACTLFATRAVSVMLTSLFLFAIVTIHAAAHVVSFPLPPVLDFVSEPIVLEFVFGMGLALAFQTGARLSCTSCYLLIAVAIMLPLFLFWSPWPGLPARWIVWGIPAALVVAAIVFSEIPVSVPAFAVELGDASYALYLIHPAVIFVVRQMALRGLFLDPARWPLLYIAATLGLTVMASFAVFYWLERPMTRFLRGRLARAQGFGRAGLAT